MTFSQFLTTVAIGMGVVFVALLGLSVYIGVFKRFTRRVEAGGAERRAAKELKRAAPESRPASGSAPEAPPGDEEEARAAAVIAVSLHLKGLLGGVPAETVVAIATALELERRRRHALTRREADPSWRLAARAQAMGARQRGQDMRGAWSRPRDGR